MAILNLDNIKQFVGEVNEQSEKDRRSLVLKRHEIFRDAGKRFIVEQLEAEFGGADNIKEMRLAPINVLKKIVSKKSGVYKQPPIRETELESDQLLMDHYVQSLAFNLNMQKAERYYNLHANTQIYIKPHPNRDGTSEIRVHIEPPHLYSVMPNMIDKNSEDAISFNDFTEEATTTQNRDIQRPGPESFGRERGVKDTTRDAVESNEKNLSNDRLHIFWTDDQHFTTDNNGNVLSNPELDEEQFENPIKRIPSVNLAKERDNEYWAKQGEDMVEVSLAIQLGLSDILTIIKSQGFSIMTIVSASQPKKQHIGINKAIWLKPTEKFPNPSISYVQASSPIAESMDALMTILRLLLTSNDMTPGTVSGSDMAKDAASGFSQIIAMSDTIEAIEKAKPVLMDAELESWDIIALWHNWLFDQNLLPEEPRKLGRFSDKFDPTIRYQDIKPLESEEEKLGRIERKQKLGLVTKKDMLKELHPEMSEEQLDAKLKELEEEKQKNIDRMQSSMGFSPFAPKKKDEEKEDEDEEDGEGDQQSNQA